MEKLRERSLIEQFEEHKAKRDYQAIIGVAEQFLIFHDQALTKMDEPW